MDFNVLWKSYDDKITCIVGHLAYAMEDRLWSFSYDQKGFIEAYQYGFRGFSEFPFLDGEYHSKRLFPVFEERIFKKRNAILTEEQKAQLLIVNNAKLKTDKINIESKQKTYGKN